MVQGGFPGALRRLRSVAPPQRRAVTTRVKDLDHGASRDGAHDVLRHVEAKCRLGRKLVRLAGSSFRVWRAEANAVQGGGATWGRRVARSTEPLVGCVG